MSVLDNDQVRGFLRAAWSDSQPGTPGSHEEGGFVLINNDGTLTVERWPRGQQDRIEVPNHSGGRRSGMIIVASFHTHPNPGLEFQQEPSLTDIRAVRYDPDLGHPEFEGEYVIASDHLYRVLRDGTVEDLGITRALLQLN